MIEFTSKMVRKQFRPCRHWLTAMDVKRFHIWYKKDVIEKVTYKNTIELLCSDRDCKAQDLCIETRVEPKPICSATVKRIA